MLPLQRPVGCTGEAFRPAGPTDGNAVHPSDAARRVQAGGRLASQLQVDRVEVELGATALGEHTEDGGLLCQPRQYPALDRELPAGRVPDALRERAVRPARGRKVQPPIPARRPVQGRRADQAEAGPPGHLVRDDAVRDRLEPPVAGGPVGENGLRVVGS